MTTITRQYNLPNCTLILEGLSENSMGIGQAETRPLINILLGVQCHFAGIDSSLAGGKDFFDSLVIAVSDYAQEFLSGVPHPASEDEKPAKVHLQKLDDSNLHRLIVESPEASVRDLGVASSPTQVDLTTVHLFDLVEALDQFLADSSTLPQVALDLTPVSRRYAATREPIAKRTVPAAIGVGGLALAAIAFFALPIPKVEKPKDPILNKEANGAQATPSASPLTDSSTSPTPSASPLVNSSTTLPNPTPEPSNSPATPSPSNLQSLLNSGNEISDPTALRFLQRKLYGQINKSWSGRSELNTDLIYRVSVGKDGAIVGYKPVNKAAGQLSQRTPLPELLYLPTNGSTPSSEPTGQYKVVFTDRGILQVSPWNGYQGKPTLGPQISDQNQLTTLRNQLYQQIKPQWGGVRDLSRSLIYRVAVNQQGIVVDYEANNQPASDYVSQTPLPKVVQPDKLVMPIPQEPLAQFKVVFEPGGNLEINSWQE